MTTMLIHDFRVFVFLLLLMGMVLGEILRRAVPFAVLMLTLWIADIGELQHIYGLAPDRYKAMIQRAIVRKRERAA